MARDDKSAEKEDKKEMSEEIGEKEPEQQEDTESDAELKDQIVPEVSDDPPEQSREALVTSLRWELVSKNGPKLAKHAACIVNGALYLHGGVSNINEYESLDGLYKYDFEKDLWTDLRGSKGAPPLSCHVMQPCGAEHLMVAGGWTGKKRHYDVHTFDVKNRKWQNETTDNFPAGTGLSSHAIVPLEEKGTYMVYGRAGSHTTQAKSGSGWTLRGSPKNGFRYNKTSSDCLPRVGHGAVAIAPNQILVMGGRLHEFVESHKPPTVARTLYSGVVNRLLKDHAIATEMKGLAKAVEREDGNSQEARGRREFCTYAGNGAALLFGGVLFKLGPFRAEPQSDFVLCSETFQIPLTTVDQNCPNRAAAVGCVDLATGEAYMHGGYCGRSNKVCRELYRLVMD